MNLEMSELPVGGLVPPEQLQAWKDYNLTEMKLFSEFIFPCFNRFRETGTFETEELEKFFQSLPEGAQWRLQLVRELRDWIESSRIESPGAEPLYEWIETVIEEDSLGTPRGPGRADEFAPEHTFPSTSQ